MMAAEKGRGRKRRKKTSWRAARTEFRGVQQRESGKYAAQIRDSKSKGRPKRWLGSFDTAEEAARAFDAAAVRLRGAAAVTNFKRPSADDEGVYPRLHAPAEPCGQETGSAARAVRKKAAVGTATQPEPRTLLRGVSRTSAADDEDLCSDNDFVELSALDFCSDNTIPGAQHDDLKSDVRPAETEWQQVEEFLKDLESIDDRDALIEAAANSSADFAS